METTTELKLLREIHDSDLAIRKLNNDAAAVSKKYKRGIKVIEQHRMSLEDELTDPTMKGMSAIENKSPELEQLLADPALGNIPEDANP